jgi:hypothetical protein
MMRGPRNLSLIHDTHGLLMKLSPDKSDVVQFQDITIQNELYDRCPTGGNAMEENTVASLVTCGLRSINNRRPRI